MWVGSTANLGLWRVWNRDHGDAAGVANNLNRVWRLFVQALVKVASDSGEVFLATVWGGDIVPVDDAAVAALRAYYRVGEIVLVGAEPCWHMRLPFAGARTGLWKLSLMSLNRQCAGWMPTANH